jgi:hypothetical protein
VLATISIITVVHAQAPADQEDGASARDPDVMAAEQFVREAREAAEAARQDENSAPPEQVDALISGIEAETSDPAVSLQERVLTQRALVGGLQRRYTDEHRTLMRATRRLEQLETQLKEVVAARSEAE